MRYGSYPNSILHLIDGSYSSYIFHGNVGSFYNRTEAFSRMGCENFYDLHRMGLNQHGWGASDEDVFMKAIATLQALDTKRFVYIISMTSHVPFTNYKKCDNYVPLQFSKDEYENDFFNSFHYTDLCIQSLFTEVKKISSSYAILVFGDHASGVTIRNYTPSILKMNAETLEFVPFFLYLPNRSDKVHREHQVITQVDIAPTILALSGYVGPYYSIGQNLLDPTISRAVISLQGTAFDRNKILQELSNR